MQRELHYHPFETCRMLAEIQMNHQGMCLKCPVHLFRQQSYELLLRQLHLPLHSQFYQQMRYRHGKSMPLSLLHQFLQSLLLLRFQEQQLGQILLEAVLLHLSQKSFPLMEAVLLSCNCQL